MTNHQSRQTAEDHYYAALDLYAEGHHEEAITEYEAAIAADPSFLDAMHGLARVYQDTGQFDKAIAVPTRMADLDRDDVLAHTSLSILYQRKGMVPEAEAEANKARILGWKQQLKQGKQSAEGNPNQAAGRKPRCARSIASFRAPGDASTGGRQRLRLK